MFRPDAWRGRPELYGGIYASAIAAKAVRRARGALPEALGGAAPGHAQLTRHAVVQAPVGLRVLETDRPVTEMGDGPALPGHPGVAGTTEYRVRARALQAGSIELVLEHAGSVAEHPDKPFLIRLECAGQVLDKARALTSSTQRLVFSFFKGLWRADQRSYGTRHRSAGLAGECTAAFAVPAMTGLKVSAVTAAATAMRLRSMRFLPG